MHRDGHAVAIRILEWRARRRSSEFNPVCRPPTCEIDEEALLEATRNVELKASRLIDERSLRKVDERNFACLTHRFGNEKVLLHDAAMSQNGERVVARLRERKRDVRRLCAALEANARRRCGAVARAHLNARLFAAFEVRQAECKLVVATALNDVWQRCWSGADAVACCTIKWRRRRGGAHAAQNWANGKRATGDANVDLMIA